ncbi:hypothetical protein D9M68_542220 [compost metagenome]
MGVDFQRRVLRHHGGNWLRLGHNAADGCHRQLLHHAINGSPQDLQITALSGLDQFQFGRRGFAALLGKFRGIAGSELSNGLRALLMRGIQPGISLGQPVGLQGQFLLEIDQFESRLDQARLGDVTGLDQFLAHVVLLRDERQAFPDLFQAGGGAVAVGALARNLGIERRHLGAVFSQGAGQLRLLRAGDVVWQSLDGRQGALSIQ